MKAYYFNSIRWAAPEVIRDGERGRESDVYSFGILMYEVLSRVEKPFLELDEDEEVETLLKSAGPQQDRRPSLLPEHLRPDCPDELKSMMQHCWDDDKSVRPDFGAVESALQIPKQLDPVVYETKRAAMNAIHEALRRTEVDDDIRAATAGFEEQSGHLEDLLVRVCMTEKLLKKSKAFRGLGALREVIEAHSKLLKLDDWSGVQEVANMRNYLSHGKKRVFFLSPEDALRLSGTCLVVLAVCKPLVLEEDVYKKV
jgi:serine/threonine protein kinase